MMTYTEIYRRMIQRTSDPEDRKALQYGERLIRSQEPAGTPYNGKCPECGERIHTRWRFCPFCGKAQIYIPPWKV